MTHRELRVFGTVGLVLGLVVGLVSPAASVEGDPLHEASVDPVMSGPLATPEELEALGFEHEEIERQRLFLDQLSAEAKVEQELLRDEAADVVPVTPPLVETPSTGIAPLTTQVTCTTTSSYAYRIGNNYTGGQTRCYQGAGTYNLASPWYTWWLQPNSWQGRVLWANPGTSVGTYGPKYWSLWRGPTTQKYSFDVNSNQYYTFSVQLVCPSSCPV